MVGLEKLYLGCFQMEFFFSVFISKWKLTKVVFSVDAVLLLPFNFPFKSHLETACFIELNGKLWTGSVGASFWRNGGGGARL